MNDCPNSSNKIISSSSSSSTTTLKSTTFSSPKTTIKNKGIKKIKINTLPTTTTTTEKTITTTNNNNNQLFLENISPCSNENKPLINSSNGLPFKCSPENRCPDTHFCHISDINYLSNKCCPKNGEPCIQPLSEGEGNSQLERFYFDSIKRRCRSFIYKGAFGNANNFLLEEDCEYICSTFIHPNPCSHGYPLIIDELNNNNKPLICGNNELIDFLLSDDDSLISSGCPNGYWCHVGSSPETTNCCPNIPNISGNNNNICDLTLELGNGTERLNRWYFDSSIRRCRKFWYSGLKGNRNNFLSREHCQQICENNYSSLLPDDILQQQGQINGKLFPKIFKRNFCLKGEPLINKNGNLIKCGKYKEKINEEELEGKEEEECPNTHYCHYGKSIEETGCCLKNGIDRCLLSLNRGVDIDNSWITRWHFNVATGKCEVFNYAGIKGNENNFITKKECEHYCLDKKVFNYCPHGEPKWENNGKTLEPKKCGLKSTTDCGDGFICHLNIEKKMEICCEDPAYFCLKPRDPGHCSDNQIRYGYNPMTDNCVSYRYSGCGGTLNQFETLEQCKEICCKQYAENSKQKRR